MTKLRAGKKQFGVVLPTELLEWLDAFASLTYTARSGAIVKLIRDGQIKYDLTKLSEERTKHLTSY